MTGKSNLEFEKTYVPEDYDGHYRNSFSTKTSKKQLFLASLAGFLACVALQLFYNPGRFVSCPTNHKVPMVADKVTALAPPYVGSSEVHSYPPTNPTNANPTLFPSDIGYPGGTPTGAEPAVIITAPSYPMQTGAAQLVKPLTMGNKSSEGNRSKNFNLFKKWGNLQCRTLKIDLLACPNL
ncbi:hypothetical protein DXG01_016641 [Tephrocybe rancida]|nr:hypothetical protein DXG01_016641 [Tephrocybe rancida]